jgi:hypothetical protein
VNQEFQSAPYGGRVIASIILVFATTLGVVVVELWVCLHGRSRPLGTEMVAVLAAAPLLVLGASYVGFLCERACVARFRIEDGALVLGRKRFPLEGLASAERDSAVLKGALRLWGNGGLGAIRGRFWSRRLRCFQAFLTDTDHAVLLRWSSGRLVTVSPADPESFIQAARQAAGRAQPR